MTTLDLIRSATQRAAGDPRLAWLREQRQASLQRLERDGLPNTSLEAWRYTDLEPTLASALDDASRSQEISEPQPNPASSSLFESGQSLRVIVHDGVIVSDSDINTQDLRICAFGRTDDPIREAIAATMAAAAKSSGSALADVNGALLSEGVFIGLAAGATPALPIEISFSGRICGQTRIVVQAGADARATIVSHHTSGGLSNTVTDVAAGPRSKLAMLRLQTQTSEATHLSCLRLVLDAAAQLSLQHIDIGARLSRNDLFATLAGADSQLDVHGLLLADGDRHVDQYSRVTHVGERTASRQLVRGIADGSGRGIFNGRIVVEKTASGTDARLTNQNLLLSGKAEIDTRPELEIHTDDVKCSHGATTGQLDDNALFYLRSRGIPVESARQMLLGAFARQIVERTPSLVKPAALIELLAKFRPEWQNWGSAE